MPTWWSIADCVAGAASAYNGFVLGTIIIVVVCVAVFAGLVYLFMSGGKVEEAMNRARQNATARDATVLSWFEHKRKDSSQFSRGGRLRCDVHVRIHISDGEDYTASATWGMSGAADLLTEGATIKVRVHAKRSDIVFPDHDGLDYLVNDYALQLYRPKQAAAERQL